MNFAEKHAQKKAGKAHPKDTDLARVTGGSFKRPNKPEDLKEAIFSLDKPAADDPKLAQGALQSLVGAFTKKKLVPATAEIRQNTSTGMPEVVLHFNPNVHADTLLRVTGEINTHAKEARHMENPYDRKILTTISPLFKDQGFEELDGFPDKFVASVHVNQVALYRMGHSKMMSNVQDALIKCFTKEGLSPERCPILVDPRTSTCQVGFLFSKGEEPQVKAALSKVYDGAQTRKEADHSNSHRENAVDSRNGGYRQTLR